MSIPTVAGALAGRTPADLARGAGGRAPVAPDGDRPGDLR